jgi:hypothetical protein
LIVRVFHDDPAGEAAVRFALAGLKDGERLAIVAAKGSDRVDYLKDISKLLEGSLSRDSRVFSSRFSFNLNQYSPSSAVRMVRAWPSPAIKSGTRSRTSFQELIQSLERLRATTFSTSRTMAAGVR